MILLIGGTSETAPLASGIAKTGCAVLVSTATNVPLNTGNLPLITRRMGRLDEQQMIELIREKGVMAIVDAAHPYAVAAHETISRVAKQLEIPCFVFRRPVELETGVQADKVSDSQNVQKDLEITIIFAENHAEAASLAFAGSRPVLLTTGSRNLFPYAEAARKTGTPLVVRILNAPESLAACREAGIREDMIIAGRGPFSVEENIDAITRFGIGTIVTKESGKAGGIKEKLAAARAANCRLIVIMRPRTSVVGPVFDNVPSLLEAIKDHIAKADVILAPQRPSASA